MVELKTLIEERIRLEYAALASGKEGIEILKELGLKDFDELLTNRILNLIPDKDKEILLAQLIAEKKSYLEVQKAKAVQQTAAIESQITELE